MLSWTPSTARTLQHKLTTLLYLRPTSLSASSCSSELRTTTARLLGSLAAFGPALLYVATPGLCLQGSVGAPRVHCCDISITNKFKPLQLVWDWASKFADECCRFKVSNELRAEVICSNNGCIRRFVVRYRCDWLVAHVGVFDLSVETTTSHAQATLIVITVLTYCRKIQTKHRAEYAAALLL